MNIDELQAGRELNAMVAEKVMGYKMTEVAGTKYVDGFSVQEPRPYSTDLMAAWEVVEKMQDYQKPHQMGHPLHLKYHFWVEKWYASIGASEALEDTVPLAICRAALKAMGVNP